MKKMPPFSERLIYYLLIPELFSRVVLELGLDMYWYTNGQQKLWVFYSFMAMEYIMFFPRIGRMRLSQNASLITIYLPIILLVHGATVGILWGNPVSKIITDSVIVFVLAGNVILLNMEGAFEGFDFDRLNFWMKLYSVIMVLVGGVAVALGRLSIVSLGGASAGALCLTIMVLGLARQRRVTLGGFAFFLFILLMIAPNMTRTTLAVFAIMMAFYVTPRVIRNPTALYVVMAFLVAAPFLIPMIIPEDSPVMRRIVGLTEYTGDEEGGSLGERAEEVRAINEKLHELGPQAEWFGYGAGGIYEPVFTGGRVPQAYSHAHYGWALFKLRYGYIGYVYLVVFGALLLVNCGRLFRREESTAKLAFLLGIWGIFFIFTYFSFNFFVAGLQFARPPSIRRKLRSRSSLVPQVSRQEAREASYVSRFRRG